MKKKNRKYVVIPLLLLLLLVTVGGTVAWLTATNTKTNTFTVGKFVKPAKTPDGTANNLDEFLTEPSWVTTAEHKLLPGVTYAKDPYVGIGKGSEDAVVYVQVTNPFSNKVYFTINEGWEAVPGETTVAATGAPANSYTSGIFKYTAGLTNATEGDVWTTKPLFSKIQVANDAQDSDYTVAQGVDPSIVVKSFIHQAKDGSNQPISDATILSAAKSAFAGN